MTYFEYALEQTLESEGGYVNDPDDRGGATNYGISTPTFLEAQEWRLIPEHYKTVQEITRDDAARIYKAFYWDAIRLDEVSNPVIAAEIFDTAVNMSPKTAVKIAQRALNYLGADVDEDGKMGPQTINAINGWAKKDERALFIALNGEQYIIYKQIDQVKFHRGWTKRIQTYRKENHDG